MGHTGANTTHASSDRPNATEFQILRHPFHSRSFECRHNVIYIQHNYNSQNNSTIFTYTHSSKIKKWLRITNSGKPCMNLIDCSQTQSKALPNLGKSSPKFVRTTSNCQVGKNNKFLTCHNTYFRKALISIKSLIT